MRDPAGASAEEARRNAHEPHVPGAEINIQVEQSQILKTPLTKALSKWNRSIFELNNKARIMPKLQTFYLSFLL
ncbi:hypothetical protein [Neobacillus sp. LXY-1]|uniref:hypothetical protein n=1 Tax=Neobacillus sp. LXY-1 TaxID=3379133 RepID=UPI003EE105B4